MIYHQVLFHSDFKYQFVKLLESGTRLMMMDNDSWRGSERNFKSLIHSFKLELIYDYRSV